MSLIRTISSAGRSVRGLGDTPQEIVPIRPKGQFYGYDKAMMSSAVWACLRLRADLISALPVKVVRTVNGIDMGVPTPPILTQPGGERVDINEWLYSSQLDLDRCGNAFGEIVATDGTGLPKQIELQDMSTVVVKQLKGGGVQYIYGGKVIPLERVWHEKQYTMAGSPVGLSPTMYAAMTLSINLGATQFGWDWFQNGATPSGTLKNTAKKLTSAEARGIKARFMDSVRHRQPFVHGSDWEYKMISVPANESQFLETIKASAIDISRFYNVPSDLIDVEVQIKTMVYANISQRNLQLLITSLHPAISRRERALSKLLAAPRSVKLDTSEFLRMDPAAQAAMLGLGVAQRLWTPDEAREVVGRQPFTPEQVDQFNQFFGKPGGTQPAAAPNPTGATS